MLNKCFQYVGVLRTYRRATINPRWCGFRSKFLTNRLASTFVNKRISAEPMVSGRQFPIWSSWSFPLGSNIDLLALPSSGTFPVTSHTLNMFVRKQPLGSLAIKSLMLIPSGPCWILLSFLLWISTWARKFVDRIRARIMAKIHRLSGRPKPFFSTSASGISHLPESSFHPTPWGRRGFKSRIRPQYPQRVVKGD